MILQRMWNVRYGGLLTKIMKYSKLGQEDILLLAKENGLEVIGG